MATKVRVKFGAQSKTVVPEVMIESDELSDDEVLDRTEKLFAKAEDKAFSFAMDRAKRS
jgi:hypothetical protein